MDDLSSQSSLRGSQQKRQASLPPERDEASPIKRSRVDEESVETVPSMLQVKPEVQDVVKDDDYYFPDGNCVLLVENTLFNVHRTLLSRDSSSFSSMFALPDPEGGQVDGTCDEHPIILPGDTALAFRHFLWSLYALPHELLTVHTPQADLPRLMDIALISNKYSFRSIETWALDAIDDFIAHRPSSIFPFNPATAGTKQITQEHADLLSRLVRLAQMCAHEKLLDTMATTLTEFMSSSIRYAYLAMTLADELDLRSLRGVAYMEVMQRVVLVPRPQRAGASADSSNDAEDGPATSEIVDEQGRMIVSPGQQLRLLSGYYRLTRVWEHLRTHPLKFDHAPTCGATWHQHGCTQSWTDFWKEKTKSETVLALGLADVVGRLKATMKEFERWGTATYMHHDCKLAARRTLAEKLKQIEEKLPDYFVCTL